MKRPRVQVEAVTRSHERDFLAGVRRSRELHRPWGAPPSTSEQFRNFVRMSQGERQRAFFVFNDEDELVGVVTISEIVLGRFRSAYLGYYAFAPHHGRGYLSSGLTAVIRIAFVQLRLHRLEANIQPGNVASIALVKRLGFHREGYSKNYLKIGGVWRDHERWAITQEDWAKQRAAAQKAQEP